MSIGKRLATEAFKVIPSIDKEATRKLLKDELRDLHKKIVVLDDDPTGVQTIHGISVYTDWSEESIEQGFQEENSMFFILTNSRGFTAAETEAEHKKIANNIAAVSKRLNKDFIVVSRSDSTLRGHYPLETNVLKEAIESQSDMTFDGEVIIPFFQEGGRFTIDNIHYVQEGDYLIPAGETEFAKDRTFGYTKSHLGEWAEEKSNGQYKAKDATYITLESIRSMDVQGITNQLLQVNGFNKVIINAKDYADVEVVTAALVKAMKQGKNFMFRSGAALTKVIGGVSDKGLLTKADLVEEGSENGGLVIIGSHVKKTTEQLEELMKYQSPKFIEFDCHLVLYPEKFRKEIDRVLEACGNFLKSGKTVVVYTKRERLDLGEGKKEEELKLSVLISDAVTSIIQRLSIRPKFMIAKGGITSSDIGTKGLQVKRAIVAGQIKPGIPVWLTGNESKFPGMSYVIFPGNVGSKTTLREIVQLLDT